MRKRKAALASAALLTLPLLSVLPSSPVSATDTGSVTQITNGNNKSTVPSITRAGDRIPFHSVANNLGLSLLLDGRPDEARAVLEPLARRSDATQRVTANYAISLAATGDEAPARSVLNPSG